MSNVTAERAKLIRDHWAEYRDRWPQGAGAFNVPVQVDWRFPPAPGEAMTPAIDVLRFQMEKGYPENGRTPYRIVCEGVVVEQGTAR